MTKTVMLYVALAAFAAGSAPLAAPDQSYPGQPTQARVWVQNRGAAEAIPVAVHSTPGDAPVRVQIAGTPSVAIASPSTLDVRRVRQTWEYQRLVTTADEDMTAELNRLGAAGWEVALQATTSRGALVVILKRPR